MGFIPKSIISEKHQIPWDCWFYHCNPSRAEYNDTFNFTYQYYYTTIFSRIFMIAFGKTGKNPVFMHEWSQLLDGVFCLRAKSAWYTEGQPAEGENMDLFCRDSTTQTTLHRRGNMFRATTPPYEVSGVKKKSVEKSQSGSKMNGQMETCFTASQRNKRKQEKWFGATLSQSH